MRPFVVHDVNAVLDYGFDWSDWLVDEATIAQSEWSGPEGVTLSQSLVIDTTTIVRVAIEDETLIRTKIELVNRVTSSDGQVDDRTLLLYVSNH